MSDEPARATPGEVDVVAELLRRLEAVLAVARPDYLAVLLPGLTSEEMAELEHECGFAFPEAYREFLMWRNGQPLSDCDVLWFNRSLLNAEGIRSDRDCMMELLEAGEFERPNWWHPMWIPFAHDGSGNNYVIDMSGCFGGNPGQIVEVWHDDADRFIVWPSFEKCLETLVVAHERGYRNLDYDQAEADAVEADTEIYQQAYAELSPGYPIETTANDPRGSRRSPEPHSQCSPEPETQSLISHLLSKWKT